MQPDRELETWRRQWQAQEAVPADLRQRVEREISKRRRGLWAALTVTAAYGAGVPAWAILSGRIDVAVLAAAVWLFIAINWAVSWRLDRGSSRPAAITTAAFLEFSILSNQRRRRSVSAASILYVVMLAFNLAWIYQTKPRPPGVAAFLTSPGLIVVYGITAVLAVVAVWSRQTLARELRNLTNLRHQIEGSC